MAKQPRILTGQVAAITGAARGIGKATAEAFVRAGHEGRDRRPRPRRGAAQAADQLGAGTIALELNVTDRASSSGSSTRPRSSSARSTSWSTTPGSCSSGAFSDEDDAHRRSGMIDININGVHLRDARSRCRASSRAGRGASREHRLDGRQGRLPRRRDLLRHQALRRRAERGAPRRAARAAASRSRASCRSSSTPSSARGLAEARGVKNIQPEDVADGIVDALKEPRFDVFVPRSVGPLNKVTALLPRSGREGIARAMKADRVLSEADPNARARLRAARRAVRARARARATSRSS